MENIKLAVIGLGYVGLPLARLFATRYPVVGYDVKRERVAALMEGRDATQEVSDELLRSVLLPRRKVRRDCFVRPMRNSSADVIITLWRSLRRSTCIIALT